jgi:leucyl-tRNA synthetase
MKILNALYAMPPYGELPEPSQKVYELTVAEGYGILLRLLYPVTPHVAHRLWSGLGYGGEILDAGLPAVDEAALARDTLEVVVQVNGKLRGQVSVPAGADKAAVEAAALADGNVQRFIEGKPVRRVIVVPGKLVNIVV